MGELPSDAAQRASRAAGIPTGNRHAAGAEIIPI
jgi:hypothetical protein